MTKILNKVSRSTYKLLPICKWKIVHMSSNHSIDEPFTKRGEVALLPLLFLWSVHLYYTFFVKFDNLLFLKRIFEMLQNLTCFWIQKNCDVFSFCASFIFSLQWMPWAQVLQAHIHTHTHTYYRIFFHSSEIQNLCIQHSDHSTHARTHTCTL